MFSKVTTMTLTQFLNEPTIYDDLAQFNKHMEDFNNIRDSIQAQIDYNNKVLNGDFIVPVTPKQPIPTPEQTNFVTDSTEKLIESKDELKRIADALDYLVHPGKILYALLMWTIDQSYILCLIAALIALILYALGDKGKLKYVPISLATYILLQIIGACLK